MEPAKCKKCGAEINAATVAFGICGNCQRLEKLRDEFAKAALPAILPNFVELSDMAEHAYRIADAMLHERERGITWDEGREKAPDELGTATGYITDLYELVHAAKKLDDYYHTVGRPLMPEEVDFFAVLDALKVKGFITPDQPPVTLT